MTENALNGKFKDWWRKHRRKFLIALGGIIGGAIGAAVASAITIGMDSLDQNQRTQDFDLSEKEERMLSFWIERFTNFYKSLVALIDGKISSRSQLSGFIETLNHVNKHIAIIEAYVKSSGEVMFTANMLKAREIFVLDQLNVFKSELQKFVDGRGLNISYIDEPFKPSDTISAYGLNFRWLNSEESSYKYAIANSNGDVIIDDDSSNDNDSSGDSTNTGNNNGNNDNNNSNNGATDVEIITPPQANKKSNKGFKILGALIVGLAIGRLSKNKS